ncbi:MAG TPA: VapE domain-containing protein [Methylibium sp.]|uniref:VapE domain-containing protein n=1 Tax=Methylibium sp. TaxID=2067992 RepID=UPI002DBFF19E|nr:VapE domain-containing protein [Methylibium sp.]HEU4458454.1 VapE domain-containing protein [Methylibium sp.]
MTDRTPIDFADVAAALLDRAEQLVSAWLPGGRRQGAEWVCGGLDGELGTSCSINLRTGLWADFATDQRGGDLLSLYAEIHGLSQAAAARALIEQLGLQAPAATPRGGDVEARVTGGADGAQRGGWRPITPVPESAPAPTFAHWHYTPADLEASWAYRHDSRLYGYVVRYRRSGGAKVILPLTWCVDEGDDRSTMRWHNKQWSEPRPLYLPAGALREADVPVLIVEGEKCADAAHGLVGDCWDVVSWPGGCKAWGKADWSWIAGRSVVLWPDCDAHRTSLSAAERAAGLAPQSKPLLPAARQPGTVAMRGIAAKLASELACKVAFVPIPEPGAVAAGWDVADAAAEGWTAERIAELLRRAVTAEPSPPPTAAGALGPPQPADAGDWRELLITRGQKVMACRENVVLACDGRPDQGVPGILALRGLIGFNEFTNNVEKLRDAPWGSKAGPWSETDETWLGEWLAHEHGMPPMPRSTLEEAARMVAARNAFHPVRKLIDAHRGRWDGTRRLASWLARACLEEDEFDPRDPLQRYLARVGTWLLMAMVKRALSPGCKFDNMVIFEGPQGWGKSSLARALSQGYFSDTGLQLDRGNDCYQNLQGVWVVEWPELDSLNRAEVSAVKAFISSQTDRFRATYDRRPHDYPRQVVFIGTTNEDHYLSDTTGNRRFWPVRITRPVDLPWVRANLPQMLAEALVYIEAGERYWPTAEEQRDLFEPQQQRRTVETSLEAAIKRYLHDPTHAVPFGSIKGSTAPEVQLVELLRVVGYPLDRQTDALVRKASSIMRKLGWTVHRSSAEGRPRVWRRPKELPDAEAFARPPAAGASHGRGTVAFDDEIGAHGPLQ